MLLLDISLRLMLTKLLVAVLIFLIYNVSLGLQLLLFPGLTLQSLFTLSENVELKIIWDLTSDMFPLQRGFSWDWTPFSRHSTVVVGETQRRGRNLITEFRGGRGVTF